MILSRIRINKWRIVYFVLRTEFCERGTLNFERNTQNGICGRSIVVMHWLPKPATRVRFPSPAFCGSQSTRCFRPFRKDAVSQSFAPNESGVFHAEKALFWIRLVINQGLLEYAADVSLRMALNLEKLRYLPIARCPPRTRRTQNRDQYPRRRVWAGEVCILCTV